MLVVMAVMVVVVVMVVMVVVVVMGVMGVVVLEKRFVGFTHRPCLKVLLTTSITLGPGPS